MAVKNPKALTIGLILAASFLAVLGLIFAPLFGGGMNGLDFADDLFNKLSKGSSYFVPRLREQVAAAEGRGFSVEVQLERPEAAAFAAALFAAGGADARTNGAGLQVSGDLGRVLGAVLTDTDAMYHNRGEEVASRYGAPGKDALRAWWNALAKVEKAFKKEGRIADANLISAVLKKGVETAYNYYGVVPRQVKEKAGLMASLLVFYVAYTMWWGFAIFYIFEGIGLTMKKAKVKKGV